jgi:hypothetical protein
MSDDYKVIMQLETLAGQMNRPDTQCNYHTRYEGKHSHPNGQLDTIRTDSHDARLLYKAKKEEQTAISRGKEISRAQLLPLSPSWHEESA